MQAKQIVPGLYAIGAGVENVFFLDEPGEGTLIDAAYPEKADRILAALARIGKRPGDVRNILVTHAHLDHIGSLGALQKATGARVFVHPLDAPIVRDGSGFRPMQPAPGMLNKMLFKAFVQLDTTVDGARVHGEVEDGEVLPIAGGLTAIHTPGHCAGQLAFLWPRHGGVLFAGDACAHMLGLDISIAYENLEEGKRSLRKLAGLPFEVACFGHGRTIRREAAARFRQRWTGAA